MTGQGAQRSSQYAENTPAPSPSRPSLHELPDHAFEDPGPPEDVDIEGFDTPVPATNHVAISPSRVATVEPALAREGASIRPAELRSWTPMMVQLGVVFVLCALLPYVCIVAAWSMWVSPQIEQNIAERTQPPPPLPAQVIEVVKPVPVIVRAPTRSEVTEPVAEPTPAPVPRPRSRPRPRPAPVAPEPIVEPTPVPVAVPAPSPPPPTTPAAAEALDGRLAGGSGAKALTLDLDFESDRRVTGIVTLPDGSRNVVRGSYTLQGEQAVVALVAPATGASYTATVTPRGATGRVVDPAGKSRRLKLKR